MNQAIVRLKAALGKAFLVLKAADEAIDFRYQDYAQRRFDQLDQRIASLERLAAPAAKPARRSTPDPTEG